MLTTISHQISDPDHHKKPQVPPMARGVIHRLQVADDPRLSYCLFISQTMNPELPLFIAVHGIRRGASSQASQFAPFIESIGGVLVAPLFHKRRFRDYQRLGRHGKGDRADMALKRIVADVSEKLGVAYPQLVLFGYSGGGQFVHRYAMANPRQVKRMAIAASGWYTFPDTSQAFPHGIGRSNRLPDIQFDPSRFLEIPTLVLVGEADVLQDSNLNQNKMIDRQQGVNRLERARRWLAAMRAAARQFGLNPPYDFRSLNGCGHSFVECMQSGKMGRTVIDFLFGDRSGGHTPSIDGAVEMTLKG